MGILDDVDLASIADERVRPGFALVLNLVEGLMQAIGSVSTGPSAL